MCRAFYGCSSLLKIAIPSSVTNIGNQAFAMCASLNNISVSKQNPNFLAINGVLYNISVTELIAYPSNKTENLYIIPESVTSIGDFAFYGCSSLLKIELPDSLTSIGDNVFSGCSSLLKIELPDSLTSIGDFAFDGCSSLLEISIPDGVMHFGDFVFNNCTLLKIIHISEENYYNLYEISDENDDFGSSIFSNEEDKIFYRYGLGNYDDIIKKH